MTPKAEAMRNAYDDGWLTDTADLFSPIGISVPHNRSFKQIQDFLVSAGWAHESIVQIRHPNDAAAVRHRCGLVVHIETGIRPHFEGHVTSAHIDCMAGDFVLEDARAPGDYLPRLLTKLTRLATDE